MRAYRYLSLLLALRVASVAQTFVDPPILTTDQQLRQYGLAPDQKSLEEALSSSGPQIRILAAMKLADDKAVTSEPKIEAALQNEKVPEVTIQLAFALAELGNPQGISSLTSMCNAKTQSTSIRLGAAQDLLHFGKAVCLSGVLGILNDPKQDSSTIAQAAYILGKYPEFLKTDQKSLVEPLRTLLNSPDPTVRIAASQALANVGNASLLPELQAAIVRESDDSVRSQMEANQRILQRKALKHQ